MLAPLTVRLQTGQELAEAEARSAALALADENQSADDKMAFLTALAAKGETPTEIAAFAETYRSLARDPGVGHFSGTALDVVGTGGDHTGGFNISSLVVLTLASAGVTVMKHGNRGITSKCGSADLLAALGVNLEAPPEKMRAALHELGFCFFFAPGYHPAFKHIAPVRRALAERGQRTIFNFLGPLINPGRPAQALIGVATPGLVALLADVLEKLGLQAGLVGHGVIGAGRGIDELTTATDNQVRGVGRLREFGGLWKPEDWSLPRARFEDLVGGDVATNVALTEAILAGRGPAGLVDTIVLNSAVGLWITGRQPDIASGLPVARDLLLGGAVARKIADTREFYRS